MKENQLFDQVVDAHNEHFYINSIIILIHYSLPVIISSNKWHFSMLRHVEPDQLSFPDHFEFFLWTRCCFYRTLCFAKLELVRIIEEFKFKKFIIPLNVFVIQYTNDFQRKITIYFEVSFALCWWFFFAKTKIFSDEFLGTMVRSIIHIGHI